MNQIGIALFWAVAQVTLIGFAAAGVFVALRRTGPSARALAALTSLVVIVVLSVLAFSPWPHWSFATAVSGEAAAREGGQAPSVSPLPRAIGLDDASSSSPGSSTPPSADATEREPTEDPSLIGAQFWRTLWGELSRVSAERGAGRWEWPAALAILFLCGLALGLLRLLMGLATVASYRRRSRPVDDASLLELVDVLRAELRCRRRIELRESSRLATAAAIGWRRPLVLLPPDWRSWSPAQRRAVLAHEIAHVRRNDFAACLFGQLGLALHFYHPIVHWLMGRLRLEQELAADSDAAALSGGQRPYLATITELALQRSDSPMSWPARAFLPTRSNFLRRIAMLRDARLPAKSVSAGTRLLTVGALALCGLLVAGLRGPSLERTTRAEETKLAADEARHAEASTTVDLSYIPADALAFAAYRPAALFRHEALDEFRKLLDQPSGLGGELTLPMREIEQLIYVLMSPGGASPGSPWAPPVVILRSVDPNEFRDLIEREVPDAVSREFRGQRYLVQPTGKSRRACFRPDDRTIVLGAEENLKNVIAGLGGPPPAVAGGDTGNEFKRDQLVVAVDMTRFKTVVPMNAQTRGPGAGFLAMVSPLWEQMNTLILGVRLEEQAVVRAVATSNNAEDAARVKDTCGALRVLGQNMISRLRTMLQSGELTAEWSTELMRPMLDTFERLLSDVRVEQHDAVVRGELATDIESLASALPLDAVVAARNVARRAQSANNLKQIGVAMHNYHDRHKTFPPAVLYGPDGKTPYSWRVALLPYMGPEAALLHKQYRFDEPWDGPHNRKLIDQIPAFYRNPKDSTRSPNSSYFALVGPHTVFADKDGVPFAAIIDGSSRTLMFVEAKRSTAWTKPEDIPYDPDKPIPQLGGFYEGGFTAATCDGAVRFYPDTIPEKALRAMITRDGREDVDPDSFSETTIRVKNVRRALEKADPDSFSKKK